jgi:hypothetical protein
MLFLTILGASLLGTFLGNFGLFFLIGQQAKKAEKAQLAEMQRIQQQMQEAMTQESERMQRYAKMEG